ncbi:hypothetical protein ABZW10_33705 [Kitasatospora sp. NPDC004723]|uniref:hypothetical protein n=1 Tax=Kitasatospora sp. NPDC004723 TaxID=3154288 RepID=UPI00339EE7E7
MDDDLTPPPACTARLDQPAATARDPPTETRERIETTAPVPESPSPQTVATLLAEPKTAGRG